jgi:hypothetical protein
MTDRAALDAAAAAGVITSEQARALQDFLSQRSLDAQAASVDGEENLRFIRNFHDVFLAIGIVLFAAGLAVGIGSVVAGQKSPATASVMVGILSFLAAGTLWGLGEVFALRRRLFLPAIAIVLSLTAFAVVGAATLYAGVLLGQGFELNVDFESMPAEVRTGILIALAAGVIAPALFYARFRLPFSLGLVGMTAAMFLLVSALMVDFEAATRLLPALTLLLGASLFGAAVAFDARDPARATHLSDNGFWLHFAAAPLILNGAFGLVGQAFRSGASTDASGLIQASANGADAVAPALATLVVVLLLGFVSLLINRRALIVSALLTTGVAIGVLLNAVGLGAGALAASTLIVLGAFVLVLGAGWRVARRGLLGWVKPDGPWARIFPPEAA